MISFLLIFMIIIYDTHQKIVIEHFCNLIPSLRQVMSKLYVYFKSKNERATRRLNYSLFSLKKKVYQNLTPLERKSNFLSKFHQRGIYSEIFWNCKTMFFLANYQVRHSMPNLFWSISCGIEGFKICRTVKLNMLLSYMLYGLSDLWNKGQNAREAA